MNGRSLDGLKVLIYDDDEGSAASLLERLSIIPDIIPELLSPARETIQELEQRRRGARESGSESTSELPLDAADVFIVDYDLTFTDEAGPAETGERVAYLARAYSSCGYIVALNQFNARATFDLTLTGHVQSYADLNISNDQVDNPALWGTAQNFDGFRPWVWPNLSTAGDLHHRQAAVLARDLDAPVLSLLGLDAPLASNGLSRSQLSWLSSQDPLRVTPRQLVTEGRLGLRPSDEPWAGTHGTAIFAAARLNKWFLESVLPSQNVIVDAPHLAGRFPSLNQGHFGSPEEVALREDVVAIHHHNSIFPLAREGWMWHSLSEDDRITEVADPFDEISDAYRFTEDSSRFRSASDTRPFIADVLPFNRRYVTREAVSPLEAGGPPWEGAHGLARVAYQPAIQFAL